MGKKRVNIGELITVENKRKWFSAAATYYATILKLPTGQNISLLMTHKEMQKLRDRARKNPEDLPLLHTDV